jgi:hypothetical protein
MLTLLALLLGYRGSYPEYLTREPSSIISAEPFTLNRNGTPPSAKSQSGR